MNPRFLGNRAKWKFIIFISLGGLLISPAMLLAAGDAYPSKNIAWIIPFKPGGGHDLSARAVSPFLEKHLKKISPKAKEGAFFIKNEVAGAGEKAVRILISAAPDGYTVGSLTGAFLAEKFYDPKDFDVAKLTYLVRIDEMTRLLVVRKSGPKDWNEVVALSKTAPIKWGVAAFGRDIHVTSIIANEALHLSSRFIPFGGTAENMNALLRGDIQMSSVSDDSVKTLLDSGEVRPLVYFDHKSPFPGVPSIQDLGHPELVNPTKGHRFLVAPPGLPKELQKTLVEAFVNACKEEEFLAWSKKIGFEFNLVTGNELDKLVKNLLDFYQEKTPLIKKSLL